MSEIENRNVAVDRARRKLLLKLKHKLKHLIWPLEPFIDYLDCMTFYAGNMPVASLWVHFGPTYSFDFYRLVWCKRERKKPSNAIGRQSTICKRIFHACDQDHLPSVTALAAAIRIEVRPNADQVLLPCEGVAFKKHRGLEYQQALRACDVESGSSRSTYLTRKRWWNKITTVEAATNALVDKHGFVISDVLKLHASICAGRDISPFRSKFLDSGGRFGMWRQLRKIFKRSITSISDPEWRS